MRPATCRSTRSSGAHLHSTPSIFSWIAARASSLAPGKARALLTIALAKVEYPVIQSSAFDANPADLIRAAHELGMEGIIAKRKGSLYEPGRRSGAWLKYKSQVPGVGHRRLYLIIKTGPSAVAADFAVGGEPPIPSFNRL